MGAERQHKTLLLLNSVDVFPILSPIYSPRRPAQNAPRQRFMSRHTDLTSTDIVAIISEWLTYLTFVFGLAMISSAMSTPDMGAMVPALIVRVVIQPLNALFVIVALVLILARAEHTSTTAVSIRCMLLLASCVLLYLLRSSCLSGCCRDGVLPCFL